MQFTQPVAPLLRLNNIRQTPNSLRYLGQQDEDIRSGGEYDVMNVCLSTSPTSTMMSKWYFLCAVRIVIIICCFCFFFSLCCFAQCLPTTPPMHDKNVQLIVRHHRMILNKVMLLPHELHQEQSWLNYRMVKKTPL